MRETKKAKQERINNALYVLEKLYPDAKPQLDFTTPFELLIATMLSAQCTDKQVNKCTAQLFKVADNAYDMAKLDYDTLVSYIKGCGLFKTKAENILKTCNILVEKYNGEVPQDMESLTSLPGVGRKTANVVLANAFNVPAIAVDTHVFRVSNRIGLADAKDVLNTEKQLMENIPMENWSKAHHWIIYHGRQVCASRNPKCDKCEVKPYCLMNGVENTKNK